MTTTAKYSRGICPNSIRCCEDPLLRIMTINIAAAFCQWLVDGTSTNERVDGFEHYIGWRNIVIVSRPSRPFGGIMTKDTIITLQNGVYSV